MKTKLMAFAMVIVLMLLLVIDTPAFAFLTNPTSMGFGSYSSNVVKVFRNLVETGDSLFTFQYNIPFASDNYPVETATDTIIFKLYDSSGNLTATFKPYVYPYFNNNGYGDGVSGIYFAASDNAPAWGSAARLEMSGWPTYFSGAPSFSYTFVANDYTTETTQEANQEALGQLILLWCDRLDSIYSETGVVLKATADSGDILSPYGETYFGGSLQGLSVMCPQLFFIQVYIPEVMPVSYNMTMADYYRTRAGLSHWYDGFTNLGAGIGVSGMVMSTLVFAVLSIIICIVCIRKDWGIEAGAGISTFVGICGALIMGSVMFAIMMIISLIAVVALVWLIALRRVG